MISLIVIHGGESRRELLAQTLASAESKLIGPISRRVIVADPVSRDYKDELGKLYPDYELLVDVEKRGLTEAVRVSRSAVRGPYWFHLEDDFVFNRAVDLHAMVHTMRAHTYLAQIVLKRQPWNDLEIAAGGVVEMWPDEYTDRHEGSCNWLEHQLFWSNNPSLNRASLLPHLPPSEAGAHEYVTELNMRVAFWGRREDAPWVQHAGELGLRGTDG